MNKKSADTGDLVVYGPDPVDCGFPESNRELGRVVDLYQNRGVLYARVKFEGRTSCYPVNKFTVIEEA
jgi:hypothetical protein